MPKGIHRYRKSFFSIFLLAGLAGCISTLAPARTPRPAPSSTFMPASATAPARPFRIVGYVTDAVVPATIQYDKLTHINYAFLLPRQDGSFEALANPRKIQEIVQQAHAGGVKVLISVGGWGYDAAFEALASDPQTRAAFISGVSAILNQFSLDGVDIDWEYPDPGRSMENYLALMRELRAVLPGDLLTSAVRAVGPASYDIPAEEMKAYFATVDFLNIMAYDGGSPHSPYAYAVAALDYWLGFGLPPEKAVLGVPFYAHSTGANTYPYNKLVQADASAATLDECNYAGLLVNYNGIPTMQRKTRLALARASGIMIWSLEDDTTDRATSLLNAIYQTIHAAGSP